ncbi:MAG: hypothetical protein IJ155_02155 [Prevotella sp.]|nr:hypothetical protein [Prevotella sp.]
MRRCACGHGGTPATVPSSVWYTIGGQRLNGQPSKPGLYINNGKKMIIKCVYGVTEKDYLSS